MFSDTIFALIFCAKRGCEATFWQEIQTVVLWHIIYCWFILVTTALFVDVNKNSQKTLGNSQVVNYDFLAGGCALTRIFRIFSISSNRKSASAVFWANMSRSNSTLSVNKLFSFFNCSFWLSNSLILGSTGTELADTLLSVKHEV